MQKTTRLVVQAVMAVLCLLTSANLFTVQSAYGQSASQAAPGTESGDTWGDTTPPEGAVRSKEPKKGGNSYNWVQMGYASIVMLLMVGFIFYLVRRNTRTPQDDDKKHHDSQPGV